MPNHFSASAEAVPARKPRPRVRKGILIACAAALLSLPIQAVVFSELGELLVEDNTTTVHLTRLKTGLYQTFDPDGRSRLFVMRRCTVPAEDTPVRVSKRGEVYRMELVDVRFPTGERCAAAVHFATPPEDQNVVRTASVRRRDVADAS